MDETIGQKGGHNDQKRSLIITKKQLVKLKAYQEDQELKELEDKVKKQQLVTFIKIAPIIITGTVLKTLSGTEHKEATSPLILPTSSEENYKKQSFLTPGKDGNIIEVEIKTSEHTKERVNINSTNLENLLTNHKPKKRKTTPVEVIEIDQTKIPIKETTKEDTFDLDKLKNKEIVSQYEEKLKEARSSLKDLIYEYNIIEKAYQNTKNTKELEELLDRLNSLIKKINELKDKLSLDTSDKYDFNYIKELASLYIDSFNNKEIVNEIKDSKLYISISDKVSELKKEEELLTLRLEEKKNNLQIGESEIDDFKDRYDNYKDFNDKLEKFRKAQDIIARQTLENVRNCVTIQERVAVTTRVLNRQARNLRRTLRRRVLMPGPRGARRMTAITGAYLRTMQNIIRPQQVVEHYQNVEIADYSKDIEYSINEIDKSLGSLKTTSIELKDTIKMIETDYKDFLDNKEVKELLANLEEVYASLKEKEEDLIRIKEQQEKNLSLQKAAYVKRRE